MLQQRSQELELLDLGAAYYTPEEYQHCMKMLFRVNKVFGFFNSTVKALQCFPKKLTLLDVGCGGGLFLIHLSKYFPDMQLTGVDISSEAIALAQDELLDYKSNNLAHNVSFQLQAQAKLAIADESVDIIVATMVCHHLNNEQLIDFLQDMVSGSRLAVIINDLHRHAMALFFYQIISPWLFKNRLISHDGLISIRRGFTRQEWQSLLHQAGIVNYKIKWCFPFRWKLIIYKDNPNLRGS